MRDDQKKILKDAIYIYGKEAQTQMIYGESVSLCQLWESFFEIEHQRKK